MEQEKFYYDNKIVKQFAYATIFWGLIGMTVGLLVALQFVFPALSFNWAPTTFGRVRPVHTNAVIFAFVGNGIFTGDVAVNGGDLTTNQTTFNLLPNPTTLNIGANGNNISIGASSGTLTLNNPTILAVNTSFTFKSLGVGTAASGTTGEIRATGNISSNFSDERLKENIEIIPNALEKVCELRGVTFTANKLAESFGYTSKEVQVGVLAGDVQKVLPEIVKPAPFDIMLFEDKEISRSGASYKTVQYEKIVPLLIEAIKQLNKEVQELKGIK
jgi:hypothetical protein